MPEITVVDLLVAMRRWQHIPLRTVARRMGANRHRIRKFERPGSDPTLSTVRRYALAIGAMVEHEVVAPDGE
jgi:DNA-binding phage protein